MPDIVAELMIFLILYILVYMISCYLYYNFCWMFLFCVSLFGLFPSKNRNLLLKPSSKTQNENLKTKPENPHPRPVHSQHENHRKPQTTCFRRRFKRRAPRIRGELYNCASTLVASCSTAEAGSGNGESRWGGE